MGNKVFRWAGIRAGVQNAGSLTMKVLAPLVCALVMCIVLLPGCAASQTPAAGNPGSGSVTSGSGDGPSASQESGGSAGGSGRSQASPSPILENCKIMHDVGYGGVYLDVAIDQFNALGFAYGDSVDVVFSNGYELKGIPYYNGYYVRAREPLVIGYPGTPNVEVIVNYGDRLWDTAGLSEDDTATVTLAQAGGFLATQESFDATYTNDRSDYASDEQFANFRPLSGGSIKPRAAYRSATPVDNAYGRAPYVESLMKKVGIAYVLDLSDNAEEIARFEQEPQAGGVDFSYFNSLQSAGKVGQLDLSADYTSAAFAQALCSGLADMSQHEGPYLIHCIEGKDRTGFVCAVLEALCGATYDEIVADYMITYDNYYGITSESAPEKYDAIVDLNINGMLAFLAGVDDKATDLGSIDYAEPARNYLKAGGMTDDQIDALVARIS